MIKKALSLNRIIIKYTVQYGMVIFLTMLFSFGIIRYSLNQYKGELISSSKQRLFDAIDVLESMLSEHKVGAYEIYYDQYTSPSFMLANDYQAALGVDQLKRYHKALTVNDYLGLWYEDEWVYTQEGIYSYSVFCNKTLKLDENSKDKLAEILEKQEEDLFVALSTVEGNYLLFYFYPMVNSYSHQNQMIFYVIDQASVVDYFVEKMSGYEYWIQMTLDDGQEIIGFGNIGQQLSEKKLDEILLAEKGKTIEEYHVDLYESVYGFKINIVLGTRKIIGPFYDSLFLAFKMLFILGGIAFCWQFMINRRNVKEIYNLKDRLLSYRNDASESVEINEIKLIDNLIEQMYQEYIDKENKHEKFLKGICIQMADMLFGGLIEQEEVIWALTKYFFPDLIGPYYVVIGIRFSQKTAIDVEEFCADEHFDIYCKLDTEQEVLVAAIISLEELDENGAIRQKIANKIQMTITEKKIGKAIVVTGKVYDKLKNIHHSYNEMISLNKVIKAIEIPDEMDVLVFEKVLWICRNYYIKESYKEELKNAIVKGVSAEIRFVLHEIMLDFEKLANTNQKFGCYILLQYIFEVLEENGNRKEARKLANLMKKSYLDNDEYENKLYLFFDEFEMDSKANIEEVMNYINLHYKDNSLSLEDIARKYNMSASGLSKYIKDKCNLKYSEYVVSLRIEEACRLLTETEMTVQEITFEVGYNDLVSFSKKFKNKMGVSPGEYRKRNDKGQ